MHPRAHRSRLALLIPLLASPTLCAQSTNAALAAPPAITLDEAIKRAQSSDPDYASAAADSGLARADQKIAGAALLPSLVYHNQYIYTQPQHINGKPVPGALTPVFIANNVVHEYVSQGLATESLSASSVTDYQRSKADAAAARARLEIARRGLVSTVISDYYGLLAAAEKVTIAQNAVDEAQHFGTLSRQLEMGGEVAHADTIKANLQIAQRQRDLGDAETQTEKARLDLGVLLYNDPRTPYTLSSDLVHMPQLPAREQVQASATNSPDLRAATEAFHAAALEAKSARFQYLPSLSLNYAYGIDAPEFAAKGSDGTRYLGYAATATVDLPVWDWLTTHEKVKQSTIRRDLARTQLSAAARRLLAQLEEYYREAETARAQLASLDQSVADAREALRLTNLRYSAGEAPALEVVDAENTLTATESGRADGAVRYFTSLANLETLTGNMP